MLVHVRSRSVDLTVHPAREVIEIDGDAVGHRNRQLFRAPVCTLGLFYDDVFGVDVNAIVHGLLENVIHQMLSLGALPRGREFHFVLHKVVKFRSVKVRRNKLNGRDEERGKKDKQQQSTQHTYLMPSIDVPV